MPPKDHDPFKAGALMFSSGGGKTYEPLGKLVDVPEIIVPPDDADRLIPYISISDTDNLKPCLNMPSMEITMTMRAGFSRNMLLAVSGLTEHIPNNWLKMHGYPMRRNVQIRKIRRRK